MAARAPSTRNTPGLAAAAALVGLPLAAVVWWFMRPEAEHPEAVRPAETPPGVHAPPASADPAPALAGPVVETRPPQAEPTPPIAADHSGSPHAPGTLPHPITPEHARIFRENSLIGSLNGAMDANDVPGLRALLKQYRDEYPEDANVMQDGYALIADCLESPGPARRAAAQRYYDEQRDSGLRRYIRRYCLGQ